MIAKLWKNENGQVLIILALAMVALCGFVALTVDYGNLYSNRAELTKTADAAALAGAKELPNNPAQAITVANAYASSTYNGKTGDTITALTPDNYTMTVTVSRNVPMLFAKVLGINSKNVAGTAKVAVGYAASVPDIVPFAIGKDQIDKISKADMWDNPFTMMMPPGGNINNYGQYQFDYCNVHLPAISGQDYSYWLQYGYNKSFTVGQNMTYYAPSTGSTTAVNIFADRTSSARDPNTDYTKAIVGESRVMLVPVVYSIYYQTDSNGNYILSSGNKVPLNDGDTIKIIGFVGFFLQNVTKGTQSGSYYPSWQGTGRFLNNLNVGSGIVTPNADYYYGALASGLVQ